MPTKAELSAEIDRLRGLLEGDPKIIGMHFEPGSPFEVKSQHWAVRLLARSFMDSLGDAENFTTLDLHPEGGPKLEVTIRRAWKNKTPAELIRELRTEVAGLEERFRTLREELDLPCMLNELLGVYERRETKRAVDHLRQMIRDVGAACGAKDLDAWVAGRQGPAGGTELSKETTE